MQKGRPSGPAFLSASRDVSAQIRGTCCRPRRPCFSDEIVRVALRLPIATRPAGIRRRTDKPRRGTVPGRERSSPRALCPPLQREALAERAVERPEWARRQPGPVLAASAWAREAREDRRHQGPSRAPSRAPSHCYRCRSHRKGHTTLRSCCQHRSRNSAHIRRRNRRSGRFRNPGSIHRKRRRNHRQARKRNSPRNRKQARSICSPAAISF